ncbi:SDR family oxidoreductase [Streptomyces sp. ME02-8801-2C]|uniref:SDR family NAD(P)-dependent oxidoreductase n=1 Tax=Streptomyces sp. ME02-8801-2C TaxID=3028680 RepID=UPI0029A8C183|nr:SDR family oxidoreductase [Streptomyces sp. ME02-8801-2C]MDX3452091.1 SDR family oxidoreductase [Streptomyces sp. ME02-8801-2C]
MGRIDYTTQTVIVTGASSGLGAEFARQLAARGANLVLVARREARLKALADELTRRDGVTVTTVARELDRPDAGRALRKELESRGIFATGLVNNAGFGTHNPFGEEDPERLQQLITLNIGALVDLSHAYFDVFAKQKTSILINVASLLGFMPTPYLSVYGASKAFVLSFTESLWEEARGTGLRVLAISPGSMATEFFDAAGSQAADYGTRRARPEDVVKTAIDTVDKASHRPSVITNGRPLAIAARLLPRSAVVHFMGATIRRSNR